VVTSSPGVTPKPRFGPNLDSTVERTRPVRARAKSVSISPSACTTTAAPWLFLESSLFWVHPRWLFRAPGLFRDIHFRPLVLLYLQPGSHGIDTPASYWNRVLCALLNPSADMPGAARLGLYKRLFTSRLLCTNQASVYCPHPPALPALLQYYCTPIPQYTTPTRPPLCMPYTIPYWQ